MCALVTNDYNGVMIATPTSVEINDYNRHDCAALAAISLCFSISLSPPFREIFFHIFQREKESEKESGDSRERMQEPPPQSLFKCIQAPMIIYSLSARKAKR